jgi:predicted alpha/beta hydrolase
MGLAARSSEDELRRRTPPATPEPFVVETADHQPIRGYDWRHQGVASADRPVVIINSATSVKCRYYSRFAAFLFANGLDVITFDYRGIGESRPAAMRGFEASWIDWGNLDFEAILRYCARAYPGQPIHVVGHSAGGIMLGIAESNHLIRRVLTVGAQYAYWRDYAARKRIQMIVKWHMAMPTITLLFGYFPGKRLGWIEDTPRGIVRDWVLSRSRFEDTWRGSSAARHPSKQELVQRFATLAAPTLAVSISDDEFGTIPAVQRLLSYFTGSARTLIEIMPASVGERSIGHFGFFNSRSEKTLWPLAIQWLRCGRLSADYASMVRLHWAANDRPQRPARGGL